MLNFGRAKPKPPVAREPVGRARTESKPTAPSRPRNLPQELLRKLEFTVIRKLDGFLFGDYKGVFYGPSLDLAEVREYQPGDEVRRIDWNVTARTGKVHIRQYREEKEITAWIVVDLSKSMFFGTRKQLKRDLALEFAGVAASIVTRHGDKVGAIAVSETGLKIIPARTGRMQALRIMQEVMGVTERNSSPTETQRRNSASPKVRPEKQAETQSQNAVPPKPQKIHTLEEALESLERVLRRRAFVFVVSDFLSDQHKGKPAWAETLGRLSMRHDVSAVRIVDPAERELPNVGGLRLRDLESDREVWIDTSDPKVRAAHAKLVKDRENSIKRAFRGAQVDSLELDTSGDLLSPLLKFTARRRGRR